MTIRKMLDKTTRTWIFEIKVQEQDLFDTLNMKTELLPLVEKETDSLFSVILLGEWAKRMYRKRAKDANEG